MISCKDKVTDAMDYINKNNAIQNSVSVYL